MTDDLATRLRAALVTALRDLGLGVTADVLENEGTGRLDEIVERLVEAARQP